MNVHETLVWAGESPLFGFLLTLAAYRVGRELFRATGNHALAQPVLVAGILIVSVLLVLDVDYADYLSGAGIIGFFLGPATVALAVPLHRQAHRLRELLVPMAVGIPLGAVTSIAVAVLTVRALGGDEVLAKSMAPKAATTPVSIALSDTIGGLPPLTAVATIVAGILGAIAGPAVLTWIGVRDHHARGLAMGASSHGIGTSRALHDNPVEGAFSGLSMGLTALATSIVLPLVLLLL